MEVMYTDVKEFNRILSLINVDPFEAKIEFEKYLRNYPYHYSAYTMYATTLIILGKFKEAERVLNHLETTYKKDASFIKKEEYVGSLERDIISNRLKILSFMERYAEFYRFYKKNYDKLDDKISQAAIFYCLTKLKGIPYAKRDEKLLYVYKQIICYKKSDFRTHIQEHLAEYYTNPKKAEKSVFVPSFPINRILNEIKKYIPSDKALYYGFFDNAYIFKFNKCGFCDGELVDYFKVVCFHGTKNIITIYPSRECELLPCIDLNYILKENVNYDYAKLVNKMNFSCGDYISIGDEQYLIKKIADKDTYSLIKIVPKDKSEICFTFNNKVFYTLKNATVMNSCNFNLIKKYGNEIIEVYEKTRKLQHIDEKANKKRINYKKGDVIVLNDENKLIIDIYNEYFILLDSRNNFSCVKKDTNYKVAYSISKEKTSFIVRALDYDDLKRDIILSSHRGNR